eukprot:TRINITY_DN4651_c0_g1_i1.p1 TRINITY_DN4651_c0_g1~~TRINITY_DN4651_c0_g1_i1.p1  ORF type:complete len:418 (+),score=105.80 TRINITY_DN4651_c0_g1_i1:183-1436(+)
MPSVMTCLVARRLGGRSSAATLSARHWKLRDFAAALITTIDKKYGAAYHDLRERLVRTLATAFLDPQRSPSQQYGAIKALAALGPRMVRRLLLPNAAAYMRALMVSLEGGARGIEEGKAGGKGGQRGREEKRCEAWRAYGALQEAIGVCLYMALKGKVASSGRGALACRRLSLKKGKRIAVETKKTGQRVIGGNRHFRRREDKGARQVLLLRDFFTWDGQEDEEEEAGLAGSNERAFSKSFPERMEMDEGMGASSNEPRQGEIPNEEGNKLSKDFLKVGEEGSSQEKKAVERAQDSEKRSLDSSLQGGENIPSAKHGNTAGLNAMNDEGLSKVSPSLKENSNALGGNEGSEGREEGEGGKGVEGVGMKGTKSEKQGVMKVGAGVEDGYGPLWEELLQVLGDGMVPYVPTVHLVSSLL